jgi:hypothetical protein
MTGFSTYDPHDAEWETGDGFRTVSRCDDEVELFVVGPGPNGYATVDEYGTVYDDGLTLKQAQTIARGGS